VGKKKKKKKVKTRKFGHFFFSNCQNIIMGHPRKCRAGGNTRFHAEPTYWWLRKKLRQRTLQKKMLKCQSNWLARNALVHAERSRNCRGNRSYDIPELECCWNRSPSSSLVLRALSPLSLSLTVCADVRCVRDLQGLRGPSLWCCSTRKLWIPLLAEESPWRSCSSTCSCSWLDPSFWDVFRELVH
jgi:hypothetical protein